MIFAILDEHARDKGVCNPGQALLVRRSGFPLRTVQRCLAELGRNGAVTIERSGMPARNCYKLADKMVDKVADQDMPDAPTLAALDAPPMADQHLISETLKKETLNTPTKPRMGSLTVAEWREIEDAYERHLKHHRTEPRDIVLQLVMDKCQSGLFDWEKFRARHAGWCASQERAGWQYATLTFLAWIRAGMPAAPPDAKPQTKQIRGLDYDCPED